MKYEVFMGATSCIEVARREIAGEEDIPNLQDEDVVYPCDMGSGTDVCAVPKTATIWFVDEEGNEVKRFSLDPTAKNGINFADAGDVFDESDAAKSFLYFEMSREDEEWSCGTIETDGEIVPENVTVTLKRYTDGEGQVRELIDPSSVIINGEDLCGDSNGGEGSNGNAFWTLHNGKRTSVEVETAEG